MFFHGKRIHSAIFDMDGTLFDTERLRFVTLKQASRELFGQEIRDETLLGSLGLSAQKAEALAKQHHGEAFPYAEIRARADALELDHVRKHGVPLKPGLVEVLERLRKTGLTLAVATSSRRAIAEEYLINANVLKYFDITVCGDEVSQGKPHPEIFLRAASALNSAPEHCLMIEDSENGLLSAIRAGGLPILIEDIKAPAEEIACQALKAYSAMPEFLHDLNDCVPVPGMPLLNEAFPQALNQLRVGIHGFGAIGGGYLTQVFSHWDGYTRPCEIIGATRSAQLREAINTFGRFSVRYASMALDQSIENIRMIDMADTDAVIDMYQTTEIIGLGLPESAIRQQAPLIAQGLLNRHTQNGRELTLLIVLNKVGSADFVRRKVRWQLQRLCAPELCEAILAKTHFIETVVNRIVSTLSREALARQLRIKSERFQNSLNAATDATAPATAAGTEFERLIARFRPFAQHASTLNQLQLVLFHSEADMPLYAAQGSAILERLRQVHTVADIESLQMVKNRLWNGTHAIIAWYASLLGYRSIGQAMGDLRIATLADRLINDEIGQALARENPRMQILVKTFIGVFLERCKASFKDPCLRVGRDPLRKLQRDERILGSIRLAQQQGIATPALEFGAALAIHYALQSADSKDKESALIRELYERHATVEAILTYRGQYLGHPYPGLDPQADAALINAISEHFQRLKNKDSAHWNWPLSFDEAPQDTAAAHSANTVQLPA